MCIVLYFLHKHFLWEKNTEDGRGTVHGNFSDFDWQPKSETL